jgi:hypothetical protein
MHFRNWYSFKYTGLESSPLSFVEIEIISFDINLNKSLTEV